MLRLLIISFLIFIIPGYGFCAEVSTDGGDEAVSEMLQDDLLADDTDVDDFDIEEISDPLEPVNRVFFEFNDKLYFWVLKPVKTGYSYVVPAELRESFGNFFNNLAAPIRLLNNLFQGRFDDAGVVVKRFLINSTIGVYGLADVALMEYNLEPRLADLGQTLGKYGLGEGVYIVWPVLGPSNIRHSVGLVGDSFVSPSAYLDLNSTERITYQAVNRINNLSLSPSIYEDMKKYSLDPYVAVRQAFYDYRTNFVDQADQEEPTF